MAEPVNVPNLVLAHINQTITQNDGKDTTIAINFGQKKFNIQKITPQIKTSIEQCKNIDYLELSDSNLTSLDNLPNLQILDTLDLRNNSLTDEEIKKIAQYKNIQNLYLENNKIEKVETIEQLVKKLPELCVLEIAGNPVTQVPNYEVGIWHASESLDVLNHTDREGNKLDD